MTLSNTLLFNISVNETNSEFELEAKGNYCLAVITSINVIVSIICLLYITLKMSLNKFIKAILCIIAIQNILSSTILTIANTFMIVFNDQSYLTCQSILSSLFVQFRSISTMTALISIIRYAMASKASNARLLKVSKSKKQFFLKLHCPKSDLNFWHISALAFKKGQIKRIYHMGAIISRSRFEAALVYKPRILSFKNEEFPFLVHKLSAI